MNAQCNSQADKIKQKFFVKQKAEDRGIWETLVWWIMLKNTIEFGWCRFLIEAKGKIWFNMLFLIHGNPF